MFPATIETDAVELVGQTADRTDGFELYELFRAGREGTADVCE